MINLKRTASATAVLPVLFLWVFLQCAGDEHHNGREHAGEHHHAETHETAKAHVTDTHSEAHTGHNGKDDHDAGGHEEPGNYGKGMAVTAGDRVKGIQLSPKALRTTGIATAPLSMYRIAGSRYRVPDEALIHYGDRTAVYLLRDGWFMPSHVSAVQETAGVSVITISAVKAADRIVIKKTAIVRLAHLEAFGASGHGHGH